MVMMMNDLVKTAITVIVSAAVGWLLSSLTKVSSQQLGKTIDELEKRVLTPLTVRVEKLETKAEHFVSRHEVKELIGDLKTGLDSRQIEIRATLNNLYRAVRNIKGATDLPLPGDE
jgi:hypothetical protein